MGLNIGKAAILLGGLLAYKNRDKLAEMFRGDQDPNNPQAGGSLGEGIKDILDRFRGTGSGKQVDSWIGTGENERLEPKHVESAIDRETLDELAKQTGLSRDELIDRITRDLPEAVNKLTPDGKLPDMAAPSGDSLLDDVPTTRPRSM